MLAGPGPHSRRPSRSSAAPIEVNAAIAAKHPDDVQIRLDLAKCHHNLGELLLQQGERQAGHRLVPQGRERSTRRWSRQFPDKPRYRESLASNLANLALALETVEPPKVEETYRAALAIYEKLVADYPDNVDYRIGQARCLRNQGTVVADAGQAEQAEAIYRQGPGLARDQGRQGPDRRSGCGCRPALLNNLGDLHRPGAEDAFRRLDRRSPRASWTRKPPASNDRHNLAIAQNNLGELLVELEAAAGGGAASSPSPWPTSRSSWPRPPRRSISRAISASSWQTQGEVAGLRAASRPKAKTALASAVEHQRQAVQLSKNGTAYRELLGSHLLELAEVNLKLGAYDEAARDRARRSQDRSRSDRAQACFDAARLLARLVTQVGGDDKLAQAERDRLTRNYLGRTIVLLREAIDTNPKLAEQDQDRPRHQGSWSRGPSSRRS